MEMRHHFCKKILPISWQSHHKKFDGLQCEIQMVLFAPWAHKPILKEHGLVQTNTIAFGSWKAHKYVEGQGHFSML